jgi:hypothetical protein
MVRLALDVEGDRATVVFLELVATYRAASADSQGVASPRIFVSPNHAFRSQSRGLRVGTGLHGLGLSRTGDAGCDGRHFRRDRADHQYCGKLPRLGCRRSAVRGGDTDHSCPTTVDRVAWRCGGFLGGWLGQLGWASELDSGISSLGFIGFFVFMLSMGVALLRGPTQLRRLTPASME